MGDDGLAPAPARASHGRAVRAGRGAGRRAAGRARCSSPAAGRGGDLARVAAGRRPRRRSPGAGVGQRSPTSRRPRPFVPAGSSSRPAPSRPRRLRRSARFSSARARAGVAAQRARPRRSRRPRRRRASALGDGADARRGSAPAARGRAVEVAASPASAPRRAPRGRPRRRPGRSGATVVGVGVERRTGARVATASLTPRRRTPLRMRRSRIGASSTGSQSSTSTVWANSRSGTVACSAGCGQRARRVRAAASPPARASRSAEPRPSRRRRCEQEALLVGRLAAGDGAGAAPPCFERAEAASQRALPR